MMPVIARGQGHLPPVHRQHRRFPAPGDPLVPRLVLPAMAGLRPGRGHEQVLPRAGPALPRDCGGTYTRRMNWGEYVHLTSGAAAADMSGQAARAFGWPREWAGQPENARAQFPGIKY